MKSVLTKALIPALLLLPLAVGCTNKQGESEAAVFLTVELKDQPGSANVACPAEVTFKTININSHLKNPTSTDPQHFQDVQLEHYTVTYTRLDGGTRVPPQELFSVGGLVPSNGTATLNGWPGMYAYAVTQSPFDQLLPFNGGIDQETGRSEIDVGFTFQFFGETASGQRVASDQATALLAFFYDPAACP
jgi:hypothetical protein